MSIAALPLENSNWILVIIAVMILAALLLWWAYVRAEAQVAQQQLASLRYVQQGWRYVRLIPPETSPGTVYDYEVHG